jgi:hypothetical protein
MMLRFVGWPGLPGGIEMLVEIASGIRQQHDSVEPEVVAVASPTGTKKM